MENNISNINILQALHSVTCQNIDESLKYINASYFELPNMTREAIITLIRAQFCPAVPHSSPQGIIKWLVTIISIIFLIFGLIGNILSGTIMYRRARRGLSSYFYLALLAIADICVLYTSCLLFMLEITFNYYPKLQTKISCRLGSYIQHLFTYISAWLIVAVTFERFIVVRFPFQSILICRMRVAYIITLMICIFFSLYTIHCFFTMDIIPLIPHTEQIYHPDYIDCNLNEHRQIFASIDLCFYSVIPSILIITFNILIILTMFYAIKQRRYYLQASSYLPTTDTCPRNLNQKTKSSSSNRTPFFRSRSVDSIAVGRSFTTHGRIYHNNSNKISIKKKSEQILFDSTSATGIRLTCLLLIISFVYVLCTLPISILFLLSKWISQNQSTTRWQITRTSLTLLMYLNHTVNFVFYCLTGRAFRNECRKILCGLWALKDIHVSCTVNPDSNKHHHYHHQQMILTDRNRIIISQQQQQRLKRSYL